MKLYHEVARALPQFAQVNDLLSKQQTGANRPFLFVGLSDVHKAHLAYAVAVERQQPVCLLAADEATARKMTEDINAMHAEETPIAQLYPAREFTFAHGVSASMELEQQRIGVLWQLCQPQANQTASICVASVEALMQRTIPKDILLSRTLRMDAAQTCEISVLTDQLFQAGYVRRPMVEGVAQFSVRGGIVDFFPPGEAAPIRIEFWGDQIDSMHQFDLETQRREQALEEVLIIPAKECLFDSSEQLAAKINQLIQKHGSRVPPFLTEDALRLSEEGELLHLDKYLPLAYDTEATLADYLSEHLMLLSEYNAIQKQAQGVSWQIEQDMKIMLENGELCGGLDGYYQPFALLLDRLKTQPMGVLDTFARTTPEMAYGELIHMTPIMTTNFSGELKVLQEDVSPLLEGGHAVVILAGTVKAGINLAEDLRSLSLPAEFFHEVDQLQFGKIMVCAGTISAGFEYPEIKFSLISTSRTAAGFGKKPRKRVYQKGANIHTIEDITQGDLVVHISHGIGVFAGIQKMELQGIAKDYIKIKYAGSDVLYVPVTQLDLVSKYVGPKDDGRTKLNKLHSGEWKKAKSRVQKACNEMADELIELYAKRLEAKGYAFSPDSDFQRSFEDHFDYEETEDQLRAAQEIKADMERPYPMDRLLCGDVGFGKTELAFRAAFKCILDGKQCALLCPTTILAWQHYQNALQRFEQFPVKIALLSRFRTPKQLRETIKQLKTGEVDFVIGTHRLVQKDIEFHDLGLAIIDEEQRFGVAHKDRFKEILSGVDLLSISATPIPRTLNMAINGIRDISTLEQPPQDRHPVQTYVVEHDLGILMSAIKKELRRGGQVYYIHNRVETIEQCAAMIQKELPDVSIGVAHGKMGEGPLSQIWRNLMERTIDILVCTTIIETGVDVKNCNTLIIENADHFGLAQLYQLRGRVGRSNRRAFAYFTFRPGKVLTEISTKRLSAIREFTTFGSGFRIAMRDMEIRGAGSLLGQRQHGQMEAVGYDMYLRLLKEAIAQKRGEATEQKSHECMIDVRLPAHIPDAYIENLPQRLDVYKKIASIQTQQQRMDLLDELIDRFGDVPDSVVTLLEVGLLRNVLAACGFYEITQKGSSLVFFMEEFQLSVAQTLIEQLGSRVSLHVSERPAIAIKLLHPDDTLETLRQTVEVLTKPQAKTVS